MSKNQPNNVRTIQYWIVAILPCISTICYIFLAAQVGIPLENYVTSLEFIDDFVGITSILLLISLKIDIERKFDELGLKFSSKDAVERKRFWISLIIGLAVATLVSLYFSCVEKWRYITWGSESYFVSELGIISFYYGVIIVAYFFTFYFTTWVILLFIVSHREISIYFKELTIFNSFNFIEIRRFLQNITLKLIIPSILLTTIGIFPFIIPLNNYWMGLYFFSAGSIIFIISFQIYCRSLDSLKDKIKNLVKTSRDDFALEKKLKDISEVIKKSCYSPNNWEKLQILKNYNEWLNLYYYTVFSGRSEKSIGYYLIPIIFDVIGMVYLILNSPFDVIIRALILAIMILLMIVILFIITRMTR